MSRVNPTDRAVVVGIAGGQSDAVVLVAAEFAAPLDDGPPRPEAGGGDR